MAWYCRLLSVFNFQLSVFRLQRHVVLLGVVALLGGDGVGSANHGYAEHLGLALIPTGFDNEVIAIRLRQ